MPSLDKAVTEPMLISEIQTAERYARINKLWDTAFRIMILVLGISTVTFSGVATSGLVAEPKAWSLAATIQAAISAAFSAFALTDLGFPKRQRNWTFRANTFRCLLLELRLTDPDPVEFLRRYQAALVIDDYATIDSSVVP